MKAQPLGGRKSMYLLVPFFVPILVVQEYIIYFVVGPVVAGYFIGVRFAE